MRNLRDYIEEDLFSTPMNTIGMGDIVLPSDDQIGSGDVSFFYNKRKRKKKFKRYKI